MVRSGHVDIQQKKNTFKARLMIRIGGLMIHVGEDLTSRTNDSTHWWAVLGSSNVSSSEKSQDTIYLRYNNFSSRIQKLKIKNSIPFQNIISIRWKDWNSFTSLRHSCAPSWDHAACVRRGPLRPGTKGLSIKNPATIGVTWMAESDFKQHKC